MVSFFIISYYEYTLFKFFSNDYLLKTIAKIFFSKKLYLLNLITAEVFLTIIQRQIVSVQIAINVVM